MKKQYEAPEIEMIRFDSVQARTEGYSEEPDNEHDEDMDNIFELSKPV